MSYMPTLGYKVLCSVQLASSSRRASQCSMVSVTIQGPPDPSDSTQYICHCAAEITETQTAMSGASSFTCSASLRWLSVWEKEGVICWLISLYFICSSKILAKPTYTESAFSSRMLIPHLHFNQKKNFGNCSRISEKLSLRVLLSW